MDYYTISNKLQEKIAKAIKSNYDYRKLGKSDLSDPEFDVLLEEIEQLQGLMRKIAPGDETLEFNPHQIGFTVDGDRKSKLPITMASMNKMKSYQDVLDWLRLKKIPKGTKFVLTPKYDGISLCVDEETNQAWTRGDGVEGQCSDSHFDKMGDIYPKPVPIYSFGEAIMKRTTFDSRYSHEALGEEKGFANGRNMVGGKFNDDKPNIILVDVDYIRYGMEYKNKETTLSKEEQLDRLNKMNKVQVPYKVATVDEMTEEYLASLFDQWCIEYEIDGLIIDVNDHDLREELGRDTSNNPHFAKAYKNNFEQRKDTRIKKLQRNISKQGYLKPIIEVIGVSLDGAMVKNVTGINERYLINMGLAVGEEITVRRSGMVIPQVIAIDGISLPPATDKKAVAEFAETRNHINIDTPTHCPSCGTELTWNETNIELMCTNHSGCSDQLLQKAISFFEILDVDSVGEGNIKAFFDAGYDSVPKILKMSQKDMESIDRFGKRKADLIYKSIHSKMKGVTLAKLQHASGFFEGLGSKKLELVEGVALDKKALLKIGGFAEKSVDIYLNGLSDYEEFVKDLPITIAQKQQASSDELEGEIIVFTGFRNPEWEAAVEDKGGKLGSSLSKKTTILVALDVSGNSGKLSKARNYGTNLMNAKDFEAKYGPFDAIVAAPADEPEEEDEEPQSQQLSLF